MIWNAAEENLMKIPSKFKKIFTREFSLNTISEPTLKQKWKVKKDGEKTVFSATNTFF